MKKQAKPPRLRCRALISAHRGQAPRGHGYTARCFFRSREGDLCGIHAKQEAEGRTVRRDEAAR